MPGQSFLDLIFRAISVFPSFLQKRRHCLRRASVIEDSAIWKELAAGLFDASEKKPQERLELVLAMAARKLRLRAGMVTVHGKDFCRTLVIHSSDLKLSEGLTSGTDLSASSIFGGTLQAQGQLLAIDYAKISEWRKHEAYKARGWESYLGINCGSQIEGEDLVLSFFDRSARVVPFSSAEKSFLVQLAPWIRLIAREMASDAKGDLSIGLFRNWEEKRIGSSLLS